MVFGSTYCPVSRLEIKDGDECIWIPLVFKLEGGSRSTIDANNLLFPYRFADCEFQTITYKGNPEHELFERDFPRAGILERYELYMLVHKKFFEIVTAKFRPDQYQRMDEVSQGFGIKTISPIAHAAHELYATEIKSISAKYQRQEIGHEETMRQITQVPAPEWMSKICRFASFAGHMNAMMPVSITVDQNEIGKLFEKFRKKAVKK